MKVLYVKNNSERAKEFQLRTTIFEENGKKYVKKQALNKEAIPHLKRMKDNYKKLSDSILDPSIRLARILDEGKDYLVFEFIEGTSLEKIFYSAPTNNNLKSNKAISIYRDLLMNDFKTTLFDSTSMIGDECREIFGDIDYKIFDGETCFDNIVNVDFVFSNIIIKDNNFFIVDYEWTTNCPLPAKYIMFRAFSLIDRIDRSKYFSTMEFNTFTEMENSFIFNSVVHGDSFYRMQKNYCKDRLDIIRELHNKEQIIQEKEQIIQEKIHYIEELEDLAQSLRIKNRIKKLIPKSLSFKKS